MIRTVSMARGRAGPASAVAPRSRRKASTTSAPAGWSRASRAISWCRSTPGRSRASARSRRTIWRGCRRRTACAATSTTTAICWCGAWARPTSSGARCCRCARARRPGSIRRPEGRAVKLLRTIRLDPSDTFVFERAAEPGEWAVSGAFMFWDADPATLEGKARAAFRAGFLGVAVARLVDAGADRRGERGRPPGRDRHAGASSWSRSSARPSIDDARGRGRGGVRVRGLALRPSARHADRACIAPSRTARSARRSARLRPRGGPKPLRAFAFLEVEGEERAGESRSTSATLGAGTSERNEGFLALLRPSSARPRRGRRACRHRRVPQGLSGAAGAGAAAGGLRGRAHAACGAAGRSAPAGRARPRSPRSPTPMRARTGR